MKNLTIILGSGGFVGKSLYKFFKLNNANVLGIDYLEGEDYQIDFVKEFDELKKIIMRYSPKSIINLAAFSNSKQCNENSKKVYKLNVDFVRKLANLCSTAGVKNFIHSSSEWVYGPGPINIKRKILPESLYHKELDLYSRSKLDAELLLLKMPIAGMNVFINRYGIIYGNKENKSNCVVDYILERFINKKEIAIRSLDSGRSFISINDIIQFLYSNSLNNLMFKEHSIFDLQGPKCYKLKNIIDYLYDKDAIHIKNYIIKESDDFDIKNVRSDINNILKRDAQSLEEYINIYK